MRGRAKHLLTGLLLAAGSGSCGGPATAPPATSEARPSAQAGSQILPSRLAPFSYTVAASPTQALLGRGSELILFDLTGPASPERLGSLELGGEVRDIAVAGPLVRLITGYRGQDERRVRITDVLHGDGHLDFDHLVVRWPKDFTV